MRPRVNLGALSWIAVALCLGGCTRSVQGWDPTRENRSESEEKWRREVIEAKDPVLVFFRSRWCGMCCSMDPTVQSLGNDLHVRDIDVNNNPEVAKHYKILSKPTTLILREGKVVATIKGVRTEDEFRAEIKAVCSDSQSIANADL